MVIHCGYSIWSTKPLHLIQSQQNSSQHERYWFRTHLPLLPPVFISNWILVIWISLETALHISYIVNLATETAVIASISIRRKLECCLGNMDIFAIHVDSSQAEIVERGIILVLNETGGSMVKGSLSKVAEEIEVLYPNRLYLMSSRKNRPGFDRIRTKCWAGMPIAGNLLAEDWTSRKPCFQRWRRNLHTNRNSCNSWGHRIVPPQLYKKS